MRKHRITKVSRYTPPKLNGHNVAFKGKRWWIIEVDDDHPFEGHPFDGEMFIVFDKLEGWVLASVKLDEDGLYDCQNCVGPHCFNFKVSRIQEIGRFVEREALKIFKATS